MNNREGKTGIPAAVFFLALIAFSGSIILSQVLFARTPFINDEFGYIFQAKLFLSGKLYAPSPCPREAFDFPHIINNGRWYSQYPPGFPLLLAPFIFLNISWLLNPILAALSVLVIYFLALELFGKRAAILSALICSLSIWFLVTSATHMSHTANLLFFSIFVLFMLRSIKSPGLFAGLVAGMSLGFSFLIRPYETVWASLPVLIYYFLSLIKSPRQHLKNMLAFMASAGLFLILFLIYNCLTNGNPFLTGYEVKYGPEHGVGFGKHGYSRTPHTPFRGILLIGGNLKAISDYLLGWPVSSLIPLLFIFIPGRSSLKRNGLIALLFLTILSLSFGLFIYWGSFVFLGARQFFIILPCLIILCAHGLLRVEECLPRRITLPWIRFRPGVDKRVLAAVILILLFSYSFLHTLRREATGPGGGNLIPYSAHVYRADLLIKTFKKLNLDRALVIMKMLPTNRREFPAGGWEAGFIQNDPWLRNPVIFARKADISLEKFIECFPHRKIYLYWGTNRRGFLVEVKILNGQPVFGRPVIHRLERSDSSAELVSSPEEVFFLYSEEFRDFIQSIFSQTPFEIIDAAWLKSQAMSSYNNREYRKAARFLEAALQVETNYEARYQMLTMLAGLYRGLKLNSLSDRILERVNTLKGDDTYHVLPERGF